MDVGLVKQPGLVQPGWLDRLLAWLFGYQPSPLVTVFVPGAGGVTTPTLPDVEGLHTQIDFSDISMLYQYAAKSTPVASDGDVIGAAVDKSENGHDVTQATTAKKPVYKVGIQNGLGCALWDGSDDWLASAAFTEITQPITYFHVAKYTAVGSDALMDGLDAAKRNYWSSH